MRRILLYLVYIFSFLLGMALALLLTGRLFREPMTRLVINSTNLVVGAFGDKFPVLSSPYGRIQLKSSADGSKQGKGDLLEIACVDCKLENELLGARPFRTSNAFLKGRYKDGRYVGEAKVEEVSLDIDAFWKDGSVQASFVLPKTKISTIYQALRSIVPESSLAIIEGTISGRGKFTWPELEITFTPDLQGLLVDGLIDPAKYRQGQFDYAGRDAAGLPASIRSGEGTPNWTELSKINASLAQAVISVEDKAFYSHPGFDLNGILDATSDNKRSGKIRRGGSTLTQQLAKNLFLTEERTYSRKLRELLYAVEMDRELGKKRIMELYLNIVEWGPGIYGVKEASRVYFSKSPGELSPEESGWLASILRSPIRGYKEKFPGK